MFSLLALSPTFGDIYSMCHVMYSFSLFICWNIMPSIFMVKLQICLETFIVWCRIFWGILLALRRLQSSTIEMILKTNVQTRWQHHHLAVESKQVRTIKPPSPGQATIKTPRPS